MELKQIGHYVDRPIYHLPRSGRLTSNKFADTVFCDQRPQNEKFKNKHKYAYLRAQISVEISILRA